ncbi:hypothetical protein pb186bvf_021113, partial [Paramecium bursaria]
QRDSQRNEDVIQYFTQILILISEIYVKKKDLNFSFFLINLEHGNLFELQQVYIWFLQRNQILNLNQSNNYKQQSSFHITERQILKYLYRNFILIMKMESNHLNLLRYPQSSLTCLILRIIKSHPTYKLIQSLQDKYLVYLLNKLILNRVIMLIGQYQQFNLGIEQKELQDKINISQNSQLNLTRKPQVNHEFHDDKYQNKYQTYKNQQIQTNKILNILYLKFDIQSKYFIQKQIYCSIDHSIYLYKIIMTQVQYQFVEFIQTSFDNETTTKIQNIKQQLIREIDCSSEQEHQIQSLEECSQIMNIGI